MSIPNSEYWARRIKLMENALQNKSLDYANNLETQFNSAANEIDNKIRAWYQRFAVNNKISFSEAQKLLTKGELKEFKWTVWEYIEKAKESAVSGEWAKELENASARVHISRLEALKIQLRQQAEELVGVRIAVTKKAAENAYIGSYYHTAFEIQKVLGVACTMEALNKSAIEKILSRPWTTDNRTFTARCWTDKNKLVQILNQELTRMAVTGSSPDKAIKTIAKQLGVSAREAARVVMTESAAFASAAQRDCFNDLDVEQFQVVGTFDKKKTCGFCGDMNGKVFPMSEFREGETAPPFHPWCRCCTAPYFADMEGIGKRWSRNPDTGKGELLSADTKFSDWKARYVKPKKDLTNGGGSGIIKTGSDYVAEKEQEYGVPYGLDAVIADMNYINSDNYAKKFDNITDNATVNKTLLECSRLAVDHRSGTLYEDMYLINGISGEVLAKQLETSVERGIIYNDEMKKALKQAKSDGVPVIALHSHPEGYPPSVDDFNSAYKHNYALGVVSGHNGQVYVYNTPRDLVDDANEIQENIAFAFRGGVDVDRAYCDAYKLFGLEYTIRKE